MSAFIVSNAHIHALVTYAIGGGPSRIYMRNGETPDQIGQILVNQNYASVNYRYNTDDEVPAYKFRPITRDLKPVEIIKACQCYDYQACETPDYRDTEAARIIDQIRDKAIQRLPGYESAPWGIEDEPTGILLSSLV